jgi:hypothetical protein
LEKIPHGKSHGKTETKIATRRYLDKNSAKKTGTEAQTFQELQNKHFDLFQAT